MAEGNSLALNPVALNPVSPVLLVSLDGVAPRFITPERMPHLCGLARRGAACFTARTVEPPWTRPVHASMLRGIDPASHGLTDNANTPLLTSTPSFLGIARAAGLHTAAVTSWRQIDSLIEPHACVERIALDSGYDPSDDDRVADHVEVLFSRRPPDVAFAYLIAPDLVGHDHGWGSDRYLATLTSVDQVLGRILETVGSNANVLVTTDHGGVGKNHGETSIDVVEVFMVGAGPAIEPATWWPTASILDVAPTIAALAGVGPSADWTGRSLLGTERPAVDVLIDLVEATAAFSYGEHVTMLDHALQAAAATQAAGSDDDLVLAALLHDVGHAVGHAGDYGDPDHAAVGARLLAPWLPATVVDPIRLHVDAKRRLVSSDASYLTALSEASVITLGQQGGPFTEAECAGFDAQPHAARAIALRHADDEGKLADPSAAGMTVHPLEAYRSLLARALTDGPVDPVIARDGCVCTLCRDAVSGQHLIDVADVHGWTVLGQRRVADRQLVDLVRGSEHHLCVLAPPHQLASAAPNLWTGTFDLRGVSRSADDALAISHDVMTSGVALVEGLGVQPGTVLRFAEGLGFVRETNYGALFDVRTEPEPTNLAYSSDALPLHSDNPYRDPVPTVQILHCLMPASEGGATRLADSWAAAADLKVHDPDSYDLLASTPVWFHFDGDEGVDLRAERTMIDIDQTGALRSVAVNHRSLATPLTSAMAAALQRFIACLDEHVIELTLQAGEAIVFDNRRILHARRGFDPATGRHLQGCYIDRDALSSRAHSSRSKSDD